MYSAQACKSAMLSRILSGRLFLGWHFVQESFLRVAFCPVAFCPVALCPGFCRIGSIRYDMVKPGVSISPARLESVPGRDRQTDGR